jgi:hypothetical protein
MKILFLHGWASTPGGRKPTFLKDQGHTVLNPRLPNGDFEVKTPPSIRIQVPTHRGAWVGESSGWSTGLSLTACFQTNSGSQYALNTHFTGLELLELFLNSLLGLLVTKEPRKENSPSVDFHC